MFFVYILKSQANQSLYIGQTNDLSSRLLRHNLGFCRATKSYRPYILIYYEEYSSRSEAVKREKFFKTGQGRKVIESKINFILNL